MSAHPGAEQQLIYLGEKIGLEPGEQTLYIRRGAVYSIEGHFESALADFRLAETLGNPLAISFELGVLFYRKGDFETALTYFNKRLKITPNHSASLEYRARVLRDAGGYDAALADLRVYFVLVDQPNPGHFVAAARMLSDPGQSQDKLPQPKQDPKHERAQEQLRALGAALALLDQGMEQLGLTPQLQQQAVELELRRHQTAAAITRHQSLKPILGHSPEWKVRLGELLLADGQANPAAAQFNAALGQLKTLKKTPAHQRLGERLTALIPSSSGNAPIPLESN